MIPLECWGCGFESRWEQSYSSVLCVLGRQRSLRQADHSFRGALPVLRASNCKWAETSKMRRPRAPTGALAILNKEVMQKRRFAMLKSSAPSWPNSLNTSSDRETIFLRDLLYSLLYLITDCYAPESVQHPW